MKLKFEHNDETIEFEYQFNSNGNVKLYSVPIDYSEDGYYIAEWRTTEIEPVPACAILDTKLLCHARIDSDNDNVLSMNIVESTDGVTCHA